MRQMRAAGLPAKWLALIELRRGGGLGTVGSLGLGTPYCRLKIVDSPKFFALMNRLFSVLPVR
jgi:hypothetical protein